MTFAALLIALYLALDFGDPGMPGALTFNPDESVEVVQSARGSAVSSVAVVSRGPVVCDTVKISSPDVSRIRLATAMTQHHSIRFTPPRIIPPSPDDIPSLTASS